MLARFFKKTKSRQERLDDMGYKNDIPTRYIDPIYDTIMDNPYTFNKCEAQTTDFTTICKYNKSKDGQESNPFYQQEPPILYAPNTALNAEIETFIVRLEKINTFFSRELTNEAKNELLNTLCDLSDMFPHDTAPEGIILLIELLTNELECGIPIDNPDRYKKLAFEPINNDIKKAVSQHISECIDAKMASEFNARMRFFSSFCTLQPRPMKSFSRLTSSAQSNTGRCPRTPPPSRSSSPNTRGVD